MSASTEKTLPPGMKQDNSLDITGVVVDVAAPPAARDGDRAENTNDSVCGSKLYKITIYLRIQTVSAPRSETSGARLHIRRPPQSGGGRYVYLW